MHFRNHGESQAPARFHHMPGILIAFVSISALLHALPLLLTSAPSTPITQPRFGATIISTILTPARKTPATPPSTTTSTTTKISEIANNIPRPAEPKKPSPVIRTITPAIDNTTTTATLKPVAPPVSPMTIQQPRETSPQINPIPSKTPALASRTKKQRNFVLGKLQNQLSHYLTYPLRARKRGWQGVVLVAFNIDEEGQLNNVQLAKSSGYSLLDRSAVSAINMVNHIVLPTELGPLQAMELQLPVKYQLRES